MSYAQYDRTVGARLGQGEPIGPGALREHVERLTARGPRHQENLPAVYDAIDYIFTELDAAGYPVSTERYGSAPYEVNLLAELDGARPGPILEIGAHWDSVLAGPGADDNASGVAGLLEIARVLATN